MTEEEPRQIQELRECERGIRSYVEGLCGIDLGPSWDPCAFWPGDAIVVKHGADRASAAQRLTGPTLLEEDGLDALRTLRLAWLDMKREVLLAVGTGQLVRVLKACEQDLAAAESEQGLLFAQECFASAARAGSDDVAHAVSQYLGQRNAMERAEHAAVVRRKLTARLPAIVQKRVYHEPGNVVLARFCYLLNREGIDRVTIAMMLGLYNPRHAGGDPDKTARDNVGSRIRWLERLVGRLGCKEALAS